MCEERRPVDLGPMIGAQAFGLKTVLVQGGVLAEPLGIDWGASAPVDRLEKLCAEYGMMPDMTIPALVW